MRIGRMPDVHYDKAKRRYFVEKRVPRDVLAIIGGPAKKKHTFSQSVDRETAYELGHDLVREWEQAWNEVRPRPLVRVQHPIWFRLPDMMPDLAKQVRAVLLREFPQLGSLTERGGFRRPLLVEPPADGSAPVYPGAVAASPVQIELNPVVEAETVLKSWVKERKIGSKSARQRREILRAFFDWLHDKKTEPRTPLLGDHFDLGRVKEPDLKRYRKHLVDSICDDYIHTTARKELADLKTIFRYAHEDMGDLTENPAAKIKNIPAKSNVRDAFEDHERALLIRKAVVSDSPIVKWANLFGGYLGLRMAEIAEAQTTDFEERRVVVDGVIADVLVFAIREDDRQKENENQTLKTPQSRRRLPLPQPIIDAGFREYLAWIIAAYGHGPLFPMVKIDQDGRRNTYASNEVADWLNKLIPDPLKSHHSWRTTVRTMLEDAGVSSDRARWIVGHRPRDVDAAHYLKHPVPSLVKALRLLHDPLGSTVVEAA